MNLWMRSVEVYMFWDLDTCPLDPSDNIRVVIDNIKRSLKLVSEFYELVKITIVGDTKKYGGWRVFRQAGGDVNVHCLPKRLPYCNSYCKPPGYHKEEMANNRIALEMFGFISEHGAPLTMLLATSDPDIPEYIEFIKGMGCTILVAHQEDACPDLPLSGTHSVVWSELKSGPSESRASGSGSNPEPGQGTEVVKPAGAATTPLESGKVEHSDKKAVTAQKPTEPVAPQVDGAKRSYASIVQAMAKNTAPIQVKASVHKSKYLEQPRAAPQKPAYVGNSGKNFDQKTKIIGQGTEVVKPADELKSTELEHEISSGSVEKSANTADEKNAAEVNNVAADVKNAVAGAATTPLESGKVEHSDKKAVTAQKPTEPVAPQVDGAKRSYASIVQSMAKNNTPFQVKAPAQKPKYLEQPRAAPQKPAYVGNSGKNFDQKTKIIEEPGTSIFVANLPMNAIPPQLYELFKDFGPIKENGIQVRSSRGQSNAFGFIAFESATSVQNVLQAAKYTPFMLADRKLRVKEKEVDYNGSKSSVKPRECFKRY